MPLPPALPAMSLAAGTVLAPSGHGWLMVLMPAQPASSRGDGTPSREGVSGLGPLEVGKRKRGFGSQYGRGGTQSWGLSQSREVVSSCPQRMYTPIVPIKMLWPEKKTFISGLALHCNARCHLQPGRSCSAQAARVPGWVTRGSPLPVPCHRRHLPLSQTRGEVVAWKSP